MVSADARAPRGIVWLRLVVLVALAAATACASETARPGDPRSVFHAGDTLAGMTIRQLETHTEFLRFELEGGGRTLHVEVASNDGPEGPYASRFYRVQPARGYEIDDATAQRIADELRTIEARPGHVPLLGSFVVGLDPWRADPTLAWGVVVALIGLLLLVTALLAARLRRSAEDRRLALVVGLVALVGSAVFFLAVGPDDIPASWVTPMHDGGTRHSIGVLYGTYSSGGLGFSVVKSMFMEPSPTAFASIVRMNLWLAFLNTLLLLVFARRSLRSWIVGVALTAAVVVSPPFFNGLFGEEPGQLMLLYGLLAVFGAVSVRPPGQAPRWESAVGLIVVAVVAFLLGVTRIEMAGLALIALPPLLARALVSPARWDRWAPRGFRGILRWPWPSILILVVAIAAILVVPLLLPEDGASARQRWVLHGLRLFDVRTLGVPVVLAGALPMGLAALVFLGILVGFFRPVRTALVTLALLFLLRIYSEADTGGFSIYFRYMAMVLPGTVLVALIGTRVLTTWVSRLPQPWQRGLGWFGLVVLLALPNTPTRSLGVWDGDVEAPARGSLLRTDKQVELRFALEAVRAHPECLFVTTAATWAINPDRGRDCGYIVFGGRLADPFAVPPRGRSAADIAERFRGAAPCALYLELLDANLLEAPDCAVDTSAWPALTEQEADVPSHLPEGLIGRRQNPMQLGVYALSR